MNQHIPPYDWAEHYLCQLVYCKLEMNLYRVKALATKRHQYMSRFTRETFVKQALTYRKMAREAARGVLPNSTETKIVVTGNVRAWRSMLELRAGEGAELEIRRLAVALVRLLQQEAPRFFVDFEVYQAEDRRESARSTYHKV